MTALATDFEPTAITTDTEPAAAVWMVHEQVSMREAYKMAFEDAGVELRCLRNAHELETALANLDSADAAPAPIALITGLLTIFSDVPDPSDPPNLTAAMCRKARETLPHLRVIVLDGAPFSLSGEKMNEIREHAEIVDPLGIRPQELAGSLAG